MTAQKTDRGWVITGQTNSVILNPGTLELTVESDGVQWSMLAAAPNDLLVRVGDGSEFSLSLLQARELEITPYQTGFKAGLKIRCAQFHHGGQALDLSVEMFICLEGEQDEELTCDLVVQEGQATLRRCRWPKAFAPVSSDTTVIPTMQGMLLPRNWARKVTLPDASTCRALYMPWWGHTRGDHCALVIVETPEDIEADFEHPAGGPTRMGVCWVHSLGRFRYQRRWRACFLRGNYVALAKRYRQYVIETGHFVSLREKIARSPLVERLIGVPVIHTDIMRHITPKSDFYDKSDPTKNIHVTTFDQRAEDLRKVATLGIRRAYVHLDGWGVRGYDNLHPDYLPPCPAAGGWEGLRRLSETCRDLGFVLALHDQYRDYYLDAPSWDPRHAVWKEDGTPKIEGVWDGGDHGFLCPSLAAGYVRRNYRQLQANGVNVQGAYLDVFACVTPDECYNPEHPVTRTQARKYWAECCNFIRTQVGIISSEEGIDWLIPNIDLVHHAPYMVAEMGFASELAVPLFTLVYHDALVIPWTMGQAGTIPGADRGFMHALLNGGMPYLKDWLGAKSPVGFHTAVPTSRELEQAAIVCGLNRRVALQELTNHEFLDEAHRRQRSTFADGTTVTVDLDSNEYEIAPRIEAAFTQ